MIDVFVAWFQAIALIFLMGVCVFVGVVWLIAQAKMIIFFWKEDNTLAKAMKRQG